MARKKGIAVTLDDVMAKMRAGRVYTAPGLAKLCELSESTIRHVLASDRAITALDWHARTKGAGGRSVSLAGTIVNERRHVDTRVRPDLTSTIRGYDASLRTAGDLAMLTRCQSR
ncbi:hypothetical protein AB3X91_11860 [Paraburkholderia sp. BR14263]|uniref:hypothetical protein n=1 Tax=unclassified Paraburkholderia TaxID=2615204 RepID=UPI0034CE1A9C